MFSISPGPTTLPGTQGLLSEWIKKRLLLSFLVSGVAIICLQQKFKIGSVRVLLWTREPSEHEVRHYLCAHLHCSVVTAVGVLRILEGVVAPNHCHCSSLGEATSHAPSESMQSNLDAF